jgi:hypothetical protein
MIKLFRNIRKNYLTEGKTTKYFKYAIGEIILVVIGILIALQINNWNESRKARVKEVEILKDFQKGLKFDILQIDSIFLQYNRATVSINKVLNHLEKDLPYSDSLDYYFFDSTLVFDSGGLTDGAYENLKSVGFDLITNKEIRDLIILVYDEYNTWMSTWEQRYIDKIFDAKQNVYNSRFMDSWKGDYKNQKEIGTMKPLHYELLKNDDEFKYFLRTQRNDIGWLIYKPSEKTQIECKKLLKLIESDLNQID